MEQQPASLVHMFSARQVDGSAADAALLGHKGAHLMEMCRLGLPVPPGFVLSTPVCDELRWQNAIFEDLRAALSDALARLEEECARAFGKPAATPLLLAVRGATRRAQPGLLGAVLNVGLSPALIEESVEMGADATFLWDCYRRFVQDFGVQVAGLSYETFEAIVEDHKESLGVEEDSALKAEDWRDIAARSAQLIEMHGGLVVPDDPHQQLKSVLLALARSWQAPRVREARQLYHIPDEWGMAVVVQAMVFGNRNEKSGAGVAISRDPQTGEKVISGEWLARAQGEDIIAGLRTPWPISEEERRQMGLDVPSLEDALPEAYSALLKAVARLERHYGKAQNIEFVIEDGKLWLVQTLPARLGAEAALRVAVDMVREGLKTSARAICDIDPYQLEKLLHPVLERGGGQRLLARGLGASPGAASGEVVIDAEEARRLAAAGRSVILVRPETTPEDIPALQAVRGVLTARGGMTSHAAVIARGLGIPCVAGVGAMEIEAGAGRVRIGDAEVRINEWITIDGASGEVFRGRMPTRQPVLPQTFHTLLAWADEISGIEVRANADTPREARIAREFGARGIGLCRSEHMFFGSERLALLQELILAEEEAQRKEVLAQLARTHGEDFEQLFAEMAGLPVCVRLLDPPVHEFLPRARAELQALARRLKRTPEHIQARVEALREYNPMLGHRGARLIITQPGLLQMQVRAMLSAMQRLRQRNQAPSRLEIMVPFIMNASEMTWMRARIESVAREMEQETGPLPPFSIGCMIELPSACLTARDIAREAAFFSFGTNDLTQTVLGLSRDDAGRFLHVYLQQGLLGEDPFVTLDATAVLPFIRMAVENGRRGNARLEIGACGEQAGDPRSIRLLASAGLDYVSCSPFRLPIARLAAAQAAVCDDLQSDSAAQ